ncbi:MAG: hypothetical protein ACO23B_12535, partial [Burkholderiaceae bacterium]
MSYGGTDIVQRTTAKFACAKLPCQAIILAPHQYYFYYFFDNQIGRLNPANPLIYLNEDVRQAAPTPPATFRYWRSERVSLGRWQGGSTADSTRRTASRLLHRQ